MRKEIRLAIIEHAVRWTSNILVEVTSNHGTLLGDSTLCLLADAVRLLSDVEKRLRSGTYDE
jgi:hypothetical protein